MIEVHALRSGVTIAHLGLIPSFLDEDDPRPAREQFDERYAGGWKPRPKFKLNGFVLTYPGDEVMEAFAMIKFNGEQILFFPHAWIAIVKENDGSYEVARMD